MSEVITLGHLCLALNVSESCSLALRFYCGISTRAGGQGVASHAHELQHIPNCHFSSGL